MDIFTWLDYAVIGLFVLLGVVIVGLFVDQGPKKWLMILGVIASGGLALFFIHKKNRYTQAKLDQHNKAIQKLLGLVDERDAVIQQNNQEIAKLSQQRDHLSRLAEIDQKKMADINQRLQKRLDAAHRINAQIDAQEKVLDTYLTERQAEQPLKGSSDILARYGLVGQRAHTRPMVSDPAPEPKGDTSISVKGFRMKGDV